MVDPTSPISQSMDSPKSPRRSPADSPSGSPTNASPDLPSVLTHSPSEQLDLQLSRVEEYRQLFLLPSEEVLIQDFNCALQENFLLQGHMYLFVHCICFYSNLSGFETKKIIQFHEITAVRRAKDVAVFPTAIEIIAAGRKYFFTSFLFQDEAFKLINEGWLQHSNVSHEVTEQQESKSDISIQREGMRDRDAEDVYTDRLSTLPESILQHILCFLDQTSAVKTSVLSKPWRYLWCTRPMVEFAEGSTVDGDTDDLVSAVNSTLQIYLDQKVRLQVFSLSLSNADGDKVSLLNKWIPVLVQKDMGVETLDLTVYSNDSGVFELPSSVFVSESLRSLYLQGCLLKSMPACIDAKHLQKLYFDHVHLLV